jgi:hypothetical protein
MAASVTDSITAYHTSAGASLETGTLTPTGSNKVIYAIVGVGAGTPDDPSDVRYASTGGSGGETMTLIDTTRSLSGFVKANIWRLASPSASSGTIWANTHSDDEATIIAIALDGAAGTETVTYASGTSTALSVSATSTSGDLVLSLGGSSLPSDTDATITSGDTSIVDVDGTTGPGYQIWGAGYEIAAGSSTTLSFTASTSGDWGIFGINVDSGGSPATATTFTGPSTGVDDVQSTDFTVGANGTITGTVTCTFTNSLSGTWSFATRDISSGTPTQTVKYTPSVPGTHVLGVTDNGGLTDATSINYVVDAVSRPSAVTPNTWTDEAGGSLVVADINDASDSTGAKDPAGASYPVLAFTMDTPMAASVAQTCYFRGRDITAGKQARQVLFATDGTTVVATGAWHTMTGSLATYSDVLTPTATAYKGEIQTRAAGGGAYSLSFPSNVTGSDTSAPFVAIQFADPQADGLPIWGTGSGASRLGVTYIWKYRPRQQTGYYVTMWWSNNGTLLWDSGSTNTYYGAHPYPQSGNNAGTTHWWELAGTNGGADYTSTLAATTKTVVQDVWYTQALRVIVNGDGTKTVRFYIDLPSTANGDIIQNIAASTWGETDPPDPAITFGDSPWYASFQHERMSGEFDSVKIIAKGLSESDMLSEAADMSQLVTSDGATYIWWGKDGFDTVDDLTCDYGTGRTFVWADTGNKATLGDRP